MSADTVRKWPLIEAVVRNDGSGEVRIDGTAYHVEAAGIAEARIEVLRHVTDSAIRIGRPVRASAEGPEGVWNLVVHPDGTVVPDEAGPTPSAPTPVQAAGAAIPVSDAVSPAPDAGLAAPGSVVGERSPDVAAPGFASSEAGAAAAEPAPVVSEPGSAMPEPVAADRESVPTRDPEALSVTEPEPTDDGPADESFATPVVTPAGPLAQGPAGAPAPTSTPAPAPEPAPTPSRVTEARPVQAAEPGDAFVAPARRDFAAPPADVPAAGPTVPESPVDTIRGFGTVTTPSDTDTLPAGTSPGVGGDIRRSFLTQVSVEEPAEQGLRGLLTRVGLRMSPNASERAERSDEREVSQHWPGPRTISIVNGKGGAGKTPSSVLLSAVFAQYGGAGVVAWDNNQTRGTLGWRTEKGPHDATLLDMLPRTDHLLGPSAQAADLARYVHHQTRDRYDVLRSKPMAMANEQRIDPADVDSIHSVLSKYYRLIVIDSGNDESDPMWQRMIDLTDQLVIATTTRDDHAEAGALLLEGLAQRDGRSAYLAQQAVVVVSQADQKAPQREVRDVAAGYEPIAREVVTVPFDPGMVDGHLRYGALRSATKRAWLAAGAAVARGL